MITRIRYKTDKGVMTSVTPLFAQTTLLKVEIDLTKMEYRIFNDEGIRVKAGVSYSKQKILNDVKAEVKKLGVLFHDEIRPRKVKKVKDFKDNTDELSVEEII